MTRDEWLKIKVDDMVQRNLVLPTQRCPEGLTSKVLQTRSDGSIVVWDKDGRELRTADPHYWKHIPLKENNMHDFDKFAPLRNVAVKIKPMPGALEGQRLTADQLEQAAIEARADEEAEASRQAISDRIASELALAQATLLLLSDVRALCVNATATAPREALAQFRRELQPLAETYGVRIVLIGDKSTATLVTI